MLLHGGVPQIGGLYASWMLKNSANLSGSFSLFSLSGLSDLSDQQNRRDRPEKPDRPEEYFHSLLRELFERRVEAIHSTDDRLHAGRIREPNMLGASKWLAGNHSDLRFLQQVVCKVGRSGDRSA